MDHRKQENTHRKHSMPQGVAAELIELTIFWFNTSLSSKVWSREIFPSSDLIVVCAICDKANRTPSTPYDAFSASVTRTYSTPSIWMVTLSLVMALWPATGTAISLSEWAYATLSTNGMRRFSPGSRIFYCFCWFFLFFVVKFEGLDREDGEDGEGGENGEGGEGGRGGGW